jgi:hypothetical protein
MLGGFGMPSTLTTFAGKWMELENIILSEVSEGGLFKGTHIFGEN